MGGATMNVRLAHIDEKLPNFALLLSELAQAAKRPLDDMDKYQCWPPGQAPEQDHTPYFLLRALIAAAEWIAEQNASQTANGRLISAAPELLEALVDLLGTEDDPSNLCHWCGRKLEGLCDSDDCPAYKAKAAIAKATGGP